MNGDSRRNFEPSWKVGEKYTRRQGPGSGAAESPVVLNFPQLPKASEMVFFGGIVARSLMLMLCWFSLLPFYPLLYIDKINLMPIVSISWINYPL